MKKIFCILVFCASATILFSQIPELGVSKNFADTSTINFAKPDSGQFIRLYPVHFADTTEKNNIVLKQEFYDTLTFIITSLPACIFELSAHSESKGPDQQNISVTKKRAQNMMLYLMQKCGIQKKNIIATGYGDTQLLNQCDDGIECTPEQNAVNRRMELKIIGFIE
jgi:outer membrane protein OmpA-like peptidoglycan-associated protein